MLPLPHHSPERWAICAERLSQVRLASSPEQLTAALADLNAAGYPALLVDARASGIAPIRKAAQMALEAPRLLSEPIPMLPQRSNGEVHISRRQVACVVALGLFGMVPGTGSELMRAGGRLSFERWGGDEPEKLRCLLNYLDLTGSEDWEAGGDMISVRRKRSAARDLRSWEHSGAALLELRVRGRAERIEEAIGCLQVDFANAAIGGGVMGGGKAQEEIRFVVCPELLLTIALCERMLEDEAIEIGGVRQYSAYHGYGRSFTFDGPTTDPTHTDARVVAVDALAFQMEAQFQPVQLLRELNKASAGFGSCEREECAVATGNWGCGCFGGDVEFKSMIQWAAASAAGRQVEYFPFDSFVAEQLPIVAKRMLTAKCTVGMLCGWLRCYEIEHRTGLDSLLSSTGCANGPDFERHQTVFEYVLEKLDEPNSGTVCLTA